MFPFKLALCALPFDNACKTICCHIKKGGKRQDAPPGSCLDATKVRLYVRVKQHFRRHDFNAGNRLVGQERPLRNHSGGTRGVTDGGLPVDLDDADVLGLAHLAPEEQVALLEIEVNRLPKRITLERPGIAPGRDEDVIVANKRWGVDVQAVIGRLFILPSVRRRTAQTISSSL